MSEEKEVTYVTHYKGLELVHTPMGLKDQHGNKVPSVRCSFMPKTFGYAFSTSDEKLIKWLDGHHYAKDGRIARFDVSMTKAPEITGVERGGVNSQSRKPATPTAPDEGKPAVKAAKVRK